MSLKKQICRSAANQDLVIAFHCSGGNVRQWRALSEVLATGHVLETPSHTDHITATGGAGGGEFTLADESAQSVRLIDRFAGKVHLVGHSYGGAVALAVAMARPERISSIALYEPCAFHILPQLGFNAVGETTEIHRVAGSIQCHIAAKAYSAAMHEFVDYWNGTGAWHSLKPEHQRHLIAWAPKAAQEFNALFQDVTPLNDYRDLKIPVQLLLGKRSPAPVKAISHALMRLLPECQLERLAGMGHMGPLTHADYVARLVAAHIESNGSEARRAMAELRRRTPSVNAPALEDAA